MPAKHPAPAAVRHPQTAEFLTTEEARLIHYIRAMEGFGRLEIRIQNGVPVMIEEIRTQIRL